MQVRLRRGRAVSGRVIDGAVAPVPGGFILIRGAADGNRGARKGTTAGPAGEFWIGGLESGSYT
jgi:hypothetical protein